MAIVAQTFADGQVLNAAKMNAMQSNIYKAAKQGQPTNLLDNSRFGSNWHVNQRGQSSYSSGSYCIDRWKLGGTWSIGDDYVQITGGSEYSYGWQKFSRPIMPHDGKYTLALKDTNGIHYSVCTISGNNVSSQASFFDSANNFWYIENRFGVNYRVNNESRTARIYWIALYDGEFNENTLPEYQYKGYAKELNECMRYYQVSPDTARYNMVAWSASGVAIPIIFLQKMRTTPTVTFNVSYYKGSWIDGTGFTAGDTSQFGTRLQSTSMSGFTTGDSYTAKVAWEAIC